MNQILAFVFLLASAFSKTNSLTTQTPPIFDRFCASEGRTSGLFGCICSVYRTQLTSIVDRYTREINNAINVFSGQQGQSFNPLTLNNFLVAIQNFLASEIPQDLNAVCPSADAFQTCLEANFTNSESLFDRRLQTIFNTNITRLLSDICQLQRSSECVGNITLPAGFCVTYSFLQRSLQSSGVIPTIDVPGSGAGSVNFPTAQDFCPSANDVGPCVAIQAALVCNRQLEEFIRYFGSRYLTTTCTNLQSQGLRPFNSVFLQCQLVTGSNVFQAIVPLITDTPNVPSIIARAIPPLCANTGLPRSVACVNEYIGESTNRVDQILREIIDVQAFGQQAERLISFFCNQNTVSDMIQVIQCIMGSQEVQTNLATCASQYVGLIGNISTFESLPLDGASIRQQLCRPLTGMLNCAVDAFSDCNANYGARTEEFIQLMLRDDCLPPKTESNGSSAHLNDQIITFVGAIITLFYRMQ